MSKKQEEMEVKEEMKTEKEAKDPNVHILYNGSGGWDINYPGRGKVAVRPGETIKLNPKNEFELRALLSIIKEIHRPSTNGRIVVKKEMPGMIEHKRVFKFEITAGEENLPKVLLDHKYTASNMYTDHEREAILKLCPEYFKKIKTGQGETYGV